MDPPRAALRGLRLLPQPAPPIAVVTPERHASGHAPAHTLGLGSEARVVELSDAALGTLSGHGLCAANDTDRARRIATAGLQRQAGGAGPPSISTNTSCTATACPQPFTRYRRYSSVQTTSPSLSTAVDGRRALQAVAVFGLELGPEVERLVARRKRHEAARRRAAHRRRRAAVDLDHHVGHRLSVRALVHAVAQVLLGPDDVAFRVDVGRNRLALQARRGTSPRAGRGSRTTRCAAETSRFPPGSATEAEPP